MPVRVYLYAAVALAVAGSFGYLLFKEHRATHRANAATERAAYAEAAVAQANATIATLKADAQLNQETRRALQIRLTDIERDRREHPIRLRCFAPAVPSATRESTGAGGVADAAAGLEPEAIAFDPGPELEQYGAECAVTAERLRALQEWEGKRGH